MKHAIVVLLSALACWTAHGQGIVSPPGASSVQVKSVAAAANPQMEKYGAGHLMLVKHDFRGLEALYAEARLDAARDPEGFQAIETFFSCLPGRYGNGVMDPDVELANARAWVLAFPASVPAATQLARVVLQHASAPGTRSWSLLEEALLEARDALERVRQPGQFDSMWQAARIGVAGALGSSPRQVLAAVLAADKLDAPGRVFFNLAVEAMAPGETDAKTELAALASLAVQRTSKREGRTMYAVVYLRAARLASALRREPFGSGWMVWDDMKASLADQQQRYPETWVTSTRGALACLAGDRATTADMIGTSQPDPSSRWIWQYWGGARLYDRCKAAIRGQLPAA